MESLLSKSSTGMNIFFFSPTTERSLPDIVGDSTAWCSEIGSLTSRDACNSGASSDRRGPISLHQAVGPGKLHCLTV